MADLAKIKEHMEVVGSDGLHVGTVDHLDGGRIKLTKTDAAAGGQHHYLAADQIAAIDERVKLSMTAADAKAKLATA